jgi:hypothetical protein
MGIGLQKGIKFTKEAVTENVAYNKTIREMMQVTGLAADEVSRIVQVGDDWGISIDAIRTSLAFMNKSGVTPSINNLAKLADEYVATTDKAAFAEKAVKVLGRGYQTLIPLLALGGQGFKDATAAINDSLIATDDSIAASRKYEVVMDNLNDSVKGLKYSLANGLIPAFVDFLSVIDKHLTKQNELRDLIKQYNTLIESGLILEKDKLSLSEKVIAVTGNAENQQLIYNNAIDKYTGLLEYSDQVEREETIRRGELTTATDGLTEATNRAALSIMELTKTQFAKEAMDALTKSYEAGTIASDVYHNKMVTLMRDWLDLPSSTIEATLAMQDLKEQLDNGEISATQYADEVRRLYNELKNLDGTSADTEIRIHTIRTEENYGAGTGVGGHAKGANFTIPPGYNENYPLGYGSSGERVIVIPNKGGNTSNSNSFTMNVHTNARSSTVMRDFNMMKAMAN